MPRNPVPAAPAEKSARPVHTVEDWNPTADQLLCDVVQEADKIGSIIIPDSVRAPLTQGIVLKAGSLCDPDVYKRGTLIIFRLHTESRVKIGGEEYLIVEPANVLLTGPILNEKTELGY